jgi:hypothetical protein
MQAPWNGCTQTFFQYLGSTRKWKHFEMSPNSPHDDLKRWESMNGLLGPFREIYLETMGRPVQDICTDIPYPSARCLNNKVGFPWGFSVSCGSQKISATRWRSNQVTAVRAAKARWHPMAIFCTRDGAAPTWFLFAMFQNKIIIVVGCPTLPPRAAIMCIPRCLYNKVGFQWGFYVPEGSISAR